MDKKDYRLLYLICVFILTAVTCNAPGQVAVATENANATMTVMAETIRAELDNKDTAGETPVPAQEDPVQVTETPTHTPENTATATNTVKPTELPCNRAVFVADMTFPDGAEVETGKTFVKTWRLKNNGSCTWTSGYKLIFDHGDRMAAPDQVNLTNASISPGGTVDTSVSLKAPNSEGTYQGDFKLKAPDGSIFGIGPNGDKSFWVKIVAVEPEAEEPPPAAAKPDLVITQYTLDPPTPQLHNPVTVKVSAYNQGDGASGAFEIEWWAGENFADGPHCTWNLPSMVANGGRVLECEYTYDGSWYANLVTKAVVDVGDDVDETNEGNNTRKMTIAVNP